jgi:cell division protein ZapA (FtsZ GTPase activity inhibitor)
MKIKPGNEEYLEKAAKLTDEEVERLLSRMRGKPARRLEDRKLTTIEALAIQLELDDEQLAEWRKNMHELKEKEDKKSKTKESKKDKNKD